MPRSRRSRRSTDHDDGYAPSRAASPSYRPSSYSYSAAEPYPYASTTYSRTADRYPPNSGGTRPPSYTTYEYIPTAPRRRSRTPARDTTSSYPPRRRSPSRRRAPTPPPPPASYSYPPRPRPRTPPPPASYSYPPRPRPRTPPPPRAYSPITTTRRPLTPPPRPPTRHRDRDRDPRPRPRPRSPSRSRSRLNRFTDTVASALDSVPREDVRSLGGAFGGFMADQLGWSGVDGRTTDQRAGRDRWRGGEGGFWGYSTMG